MSGSSICRSGRCACLRLSTTLAIALAVSGLVARIEALDAERAMSQYIRDQWGSEKGFPGGPVYALTQTADGYLWVGAEKGLVRFDGLTFRLFEPTGAKAGSGPTVFGVAAAPDGSLWARLRGVALVRYHNGAFENMLSRPGLPESVVSAMALTRDGNILLATLGNGIVAYRNERFDAIASPKTISSSSFVIAVAETRDGELWLGTRDAGLVRVQGTRVTRLTDGLPDLKVNCLLARENGDLWIGTDKGVVRWAGTEITRSGIPAPLQDLPALSMIQGGAGQVWIAAGGEGSSG